MGTENDEGITNEQTVEERASLVGWKDGGSKTAEEFIEARDNHLGAARADIKKLEGQVATTNATMNAMVKHMEKKEVSDIKVGYDRAISIEKQKGKEAADNLDSDGMQKSFDKVDALETQKTKKLEELQPISTPSDNPVITHLKQHAANNPSLFDTADKANAWAAEIRYQHDFNPKASMDDIIKTTDQIMIKKFGLTQSMPGPDGGGDDNYQARAADSLKYSEIPQEDKAVYERFKIQFAEGGKEYTKDQYMKEYNNG